MNICRPAFRQVAAAALLAAAGASHAAITTTPLTNVTSFASQVDGTIDTFSDLTINTDLGTLLLNRNSGGIAYSATTQTGFFVVAAAGSVAVSTDTFSDTITFGSFGPAGQPTVPPGYPGSFAPPGSYGGPGAYGAPGPYGAPGQFEAGPHAAAGQPVQPGPYPPAGQFPPAGSGHAISGELIPG